MKFILHGKKCFGNKINILLDILESNSIELDTIEQSILIDMCINDGFPEHYYRDNLLDMDKFIEDPEIIYNLVQF